MRVAKRGATVSVLAAVVVAGCVSSPPTGQNRVSVRWEIQLETDSCGKLAGSLALFDLLDLEMPAGEHVAAELDRRCPDAEPEAFDFDVFIGKGACNELREMLGLAHAYNVTAVLDAARQRMADALIDDLDGEIARRCPSPD